MNKKKDSSEKTETLPYSYSRGPKYNKDGDIIIWEYTADNRKKPEEEQKTKEQKSFDIKKKKFIYQKKEKTSSCCIIS
jgi:hypothetical protein